MTNKEKIQELLNEPCWNSKPYIVGMDKVGVEDVMERFAEWKDEQEIEFLQSLMFQASTPKALNIIINNRIKLLKGE